MTENISKIAITGKLRSGKSSVADYIFVEHDDFHVVSFGSSLKYYADRLFRQSMFTPDDKRKPRELYQAFGQKMREIDNDIWIKHAENEITILTKSFDAKGIIIDDLRQLNEFEWAKENGFTVIRVNANEDTRIARAEALGDSFSLESLRHETEQSVDDFEVDYDIWNDGNDTEELRRQVDKIILALNGK